jgi:TetR/AcrR family transcriptional regulator, cholesterol catabolism regulator
MHILRSPQRPKKKPRAPQSRRDQILGAAAQLIAEHGYHKTSMDAIALAVGIHKASLYHHFESKEAIVIALHLSIIDTLFGLHKERAEAGTLPPTRQLFEMMMDIVSLAETHPGHLRILFDHYRELPEAMHKQVSTKRKAYRDIVIQVLKRGMAEGEFGDIDVDFAARAVMGLCDWATQWYRPTGSLGARAVAERTWKLLVVGLGSSKSKRSLSP